MCLKGVRKISPIACVTPSELRSCHPCSTFFDRWTSLQSACRGRNTASLTLVSADELNHDGCRFTSCLCCSGYSTCFVRLRLQTCIFFSAARHNSSATFTTISILLLCYCDLCTLSRCAAQRAGPRPSSRTGTKHMYTSSLSHTEA